MSPRSRILSERMKAHSRKAILEASVQLFAKKGFSATTAEEIARRAKVSKGLIFSHFASKEDILFSIIDDNIGRWFPEASQTDDKRPAKERLRLLIDDWLNVIRTEPDLIRLSLQLNLDDAYRTIIAKKGNEYLERFMGSVKTLFRQLGSKHPELDCYLLMFFFDGVAANYTVAPDLFPLESLKEHFVALLLSRFRKD